MLLHYVEWDGIVTVAGAKVDWGLRYRIYIVLSKKNELDLVMYCSTSLTQSVSRHISSFRYFILTPRSPSQTVFARTLYCYIRKQRIFKSPKQRLETYCFCSVSYYYYYYSSLSPFFPWTMNLSMADLRNYWTEFHETWWSKVFSFVVKGVKVIFWGVQRGWGLL